MLSTYTSRIPRLNRLATAVALLLFITAEAPQLAQAQWTTSGGGDAYNTNSSGNVGIGTTSPAAYATLQVDTTGNKSLLTMDTSIGGLLIGYQGSHIQARTPEGGNDRDLILQNWDGNVGIGTSSPSSKLHVAGDVTVTGNISAKYQDLAEWVPAAGPIMPGTVVVVGSKNANSVTPATESYDTRVAGVVSATPGIVLGEAGENKVKVATTGRVKVRVDATQAPVRLGDLLVTSEKEGVAMRSEPLDLAGVKIHRPGTLIGKALEPLSDGEGEVLVLLSLQ